MFFTDERLHFFKPLTSKYREQVVQCLALLYQRQYSSVADYGQSLTREQLIEIFEEALTRSDSIVLEDVELGDDGNIHAELMPPQRFKNNREHANWILKQLLETGWLEKQVDPASFQSSYPFTRMGRVFALGLIESDSNKTRTRHRNTRNTLNALEAFVSRGEIYDLLDAFEYSERIITDFTDVIAELEERKRELVREVEAQQLVQQATEQFFDFMEKRFQPDIQVRLSADSVEKHREDIQRAILKIKKKRKAFKADAERELRRVTPDLCERNESYLIFVLDKIEQRMRNAADIMLPALRRALHSFTKRADIIIRQLSYMGSQQNSDFVEVCRELADLSVAEYDERLTAAATAMSSMRLQLLDPQQIKLLERKAKVTVDSSVQDEYDIDEAAKQALMVQQLLDQAFVLNNAKVREYIATTLKNAKKISTQALPVKDAQDLLAMAHAIEVGAVNNLSSDMRFKVEATGKRIEDSDYYKAFDEFIIELISNE